MSKKTRICRTCNSELPETKAYFQKNKKNKCGWYTSCIKCREKIDFMAPWEEIAEGIFACNYGKTYRFE